jgi:hypothetical protein
MSFLQRPFVAGEVTKVHHWYDVVWQMLPQIQLFVPSLIRETNRRPFVTSLNPTRDRITQIIQESTRSVGFASILRSGPDSLADIERRSLTPLKGVLARIDMSDEQDVLLRVKRVNQTALLTDTCQRVLERFLEKCQRTEERQIQTVTLRSEKKVSSVVQPLSDQQKEITTISPWGSSVGKYGFSSNAIPAPIDVERLTDQVVRQIDQRLIAHRERMGTVF